MSDKQCPRCKLKHVGPIHTWRRDTQYVNDKLNYATVCYHCITEDDWYMYWDWQEYYSSQGWGRRLEFKPRNRSDWVK